MPSKFLLLKNYCGSSNPGISIEIAESDVSLFEKSLPGF
jgi:hypothetical protein